MQYDSELAGRGIGLASSDWSFVPIFTMMSAVSVSVWFRKSRNAGTALRMGTGFGSWSVTLRGHARRQACVVEDWHRQRGGLQAAYSSHCR